MKLIIGLGNPGEKYQKTRHNLGFMVLEQFLKDYEPLRDTVWTDSKKFKSDIAEITWERRHGGPEKVLLVKPKTYMNNSGLAVELLTTYYKIPTTDVWIVHDDVDIRLGTLRIRLGGGAGGHRGIESILQQFPKGDFWRFRLGIGRPDETADAKGVDDFVLGEFDHQEHAKIRELLKHASQALQMGLEQDLIAAGNKFNTK